MNAPPALNNPHVADREAAFDSHLAAALGRYQAYGIFVSPEPLFAPYRDAAALLVETAHAEGWPADVLDTGRRALRSLRHDCLVACLRRDGQPSTLDEFNAARDVLEAEQAKARPGAQESLQRLLRDMGVAPLTGAEARTHSEALQEFLPASPFAIPRGD